MTAASAAPRWNDALLAAQLLAVDPCGLGGVVLRAAPGPVCDTWLAGLRSAMAEDAPMRRMPAGIGDDRLLGGIDLSATLKAGRPIFQNGLLSETNGGIVVIPMAERLDGTAAARIAAVLDRREVAIEREGFTRRVPATLGIVAIDEGAGAEEQLPLSLAERCAFHIDLHDVSVRAAEAMACGHALTDKARALLPVVGPASDDILQALTSCAASFGIASIVAPLLAMRAARAAAALAGRDHVVEEDAVLAARLVLAPRARSLPSDDHADSTPPEPQESPQTQEQGDGEPQPIPEDVLQDVMCAAVRAAVPPGLLESLRHSAARATTCRQDGGGAGQSGPMRGRQVGVRIGALRSGVRLALVDTLRAAAPWQKLRRDGQGSAKQRFAVRPEDFRLKKFVQRQESTVVFCVDASGSTAFHRLAEAKGAVELLLGEAYVARTYAALIAFRGKRAEVLLPPSRSLTRAKSLLSVLPGGGGTPLASGIEAAFLTALGERKRGRTPLMVFLTDGQANISRDGSCARERAYDEAVTSARNIAASGLAAVFVDTSPRKREEGPRLAGAMAARYLALPQAQSGAIRDVIRAVVP